MINARDIEAAIMESDGDECIYVGGEDMDERMVSFVWKKAFV